MRKHVFVAFALVLLALSLGAAPAGENAAQTPKEKWTFIRCGELLAAPGKPAMKQATIFVRDGKVAEVLPGFVDGAGRPGAEKAEIETVDLSGMYVLPGLIDCHTHITMQLSPDVALQMVQTTEADDALNGALYARRTLDAGFTTIRNVGSRGDAAFALRDAIREGKVPGPRILAAGHAITPTGGHADGTNGYRDDLFAVPTAMQGVADGADECRKAVRAQVKRGADVIKLTATGGVLSNTAAGVNQQFFPDELEAIVRTAHSLHRKVAAHAHGTDGINAALRAGVDSIEHGSFLDDESISLFKQTGAYLVPTLLAGRTVIDMASDPSQHMPPAIRFKAMQVGPVMRESFSKAYRGGVKIAFGTDSGVSAHGENAREFELMVEAGMKPEDAIVAATVSAADLLGMSDEIGTIAPGKSADIIAVRKSPITDISQLRQVVFVMARGVVEKRP